MKMLPFTFCTINKTLLIPADVQNKGEAQISTKNALAITMNLKGQYYSQRMGNTLSVVRRVS